jgi:hypothetical protein
LFDEFTTVWRAPRRSEPEGRFASGDLVRQADQNDGWPNRSCPSEGTPRVIFTRMRLLGSSNRDFHAANEIWDFFQQAP